MEIKYKDELLEVKYTFNSFKFMEELDFSELANLERTPFKIIGILETLLMGGLNHDRKVRITIDTVSDIIEDTMDNGDISELLGDLMVELEKSSFFKNLQKTQVKE